MSPPSKLLVATLACFAISAGCAVVAWPSRQSALGGLASTRPPSARPSSSVMLSMPVADLDVAGAGLPFARLDQRLQAHQEGRPLRAAVVHELHRLLPIQVLEEHDGIVGLLFKLETHLGADPFRGAIDHLPQHTL